MIITEQAALKAQGQFEHLLDFVRQAAERRPADRHGGTGPDAATARPGPHPADGLRRPAGRRRPRAGGHDARGRHGPPAARAPRPPLRVDLRRADHPPGRLRHPGGPEDRAGAAGRAARPARGRLLLRAGGLGPAALPEGVVRRGRAVAGDAPGAAAGDPDAGADEPGRGRATPRRSRTPLEPPPAEEEGPLLVVTADGKGVPMRRPSRRTAPSPTTAGPRGRRPTRSRWPASGRSTASSRSCGRPRTSSTRCCGTRRPRSGPGRSTSTSGPR